MIMKIDLYFIVFFFFHWLQSIYCMHIKLQDLIVVWTDWKQIDCVLKVKGFASSECGRFFAQVHWWIRLIGHVVVDRSNRWRVHIRKRFEKTFEWTIVESIVVPSQVHSGTSFYRLRTKNTLLIIIDKAMRKREFEISNVFRSLLQLFIAPSRRSTYRVNGKTN